MEETSSTVHLEYVGFRLSTRPEEVAANESPSHARVRHPSGCDLRLAPSPR